MRKQKKYTGWSQVPAGVGFLNVNLQALFTILAPAPLKFCPTGITGSLVPTEYHSVYALSTLKVSAGGFMRLPRTNKPFVQPFHEFYRLEFAASTFARLHEESKASLTRLYANRDNPSSRIAYQSFGITWKCWHYSPFLLFLYRKIH